MVAVVGGAISVLAFPPFGPGVLILVGVGAFLYAILGAVHRRHGLLVGAVYGLVFFGGLMWWLGLLDPLALILIPVQAVFFAVFGWWLAGKNHLDPVRWLLLAVGGWAVMELMRYRIPVGGQEWGAAGYALSDSLYLRLFAAPVGTTGLTVVIVVLGAMAATALARRWESKLRWFALSPLVLMALTVPSILIVDDAGAIGVAIVQGSTPCPFEKCPPNERLRTFEQHLELTRTIEAGSVDLVVWPESSTGSTNADPVNNQAVGEAIGAEARRLGASILIGGDRIVSDTEFVNANVMFGPEGEIVGEYRKQHPVPFGEYIPLRPLFEWIPTLDQVPRDMIPGDGPVVFELEEAAVSVGSVISWEGGFSRYALEHRRDGANLLVVATNKSSYGPDAPTSDQFIGMTRMRAVELGVPVVHGAVTGKSAVIDRQGSFEETTETGEAIVWYGEVGASTTTLYTTIGDAVLYLAALVGILTWWRSRALVGSGPNREKEE